MDPESPVAITIDLGGARKLNAAEIVWEFPAKAFTVSVSTDGVKWSEVYATDSNVLSSTHVALGSISAWKVRVVMHEARCLGNVVHVHAYADRYACRRQPRLSRVTVSTASKCCLCMLPACKPLWKIALLRQKAPMLVISILKHTWVSLLHVRAKPCAVSCHHWRQDNCFCMHLV